LAASSALGLRSALALAVPRLLHARKQAAAAAAAMKKAIAAGGAPASGCCGGSEGGGSGTSGDGGGCCGGSGGGGGSGSSGVPSGVLPSSAGSAADLEVFEDSQSARLGALAGLAAAVDDKVDFSGSQGGAPVEPFVAPLLAEFSAALDGFAGDGASCPSPSCRQQTPTAPWRLPPAVKATVGFAARGLSDIITRPPATLVGEDDVEAVVLSLAKALAAPGAWEGGGGEEDGGRGGAGVDDGTAAYALLAAIRSIGLRRSEYARAVLDTAVPPLLRQLQQTSEGEGAGVGAGEGVGTTGSGSSGSDSLVSYPGTARTARTARTTGTAAEKRRACAALVELSEIPGVFAVALSALLAAATSGTGGSEGDTVAARTGRDAEVALKALDDVLKRGVKRVHHDADILAFVRGSFPGAPSSFVPATPPTTVADSAALPGTPLAKAIEEVTEKTTAKADKRGPWGLPLLLEALDSASLSFLNQGRTAGSDSSRGIHATPGGDATEAAVG
ncbi:unnamed protein product, partial [Hapterophycus canaliculatus]